MTKLEKSVLSIMIYYILLCLMLSFRWGQGSICEDNVWAARFLFRRLIRRFTVLQYGDIMDISNEKAISNAAANIEMEGFVILPEYRELCDRLLNGEITMQECIAVVKSMQGIGA